MTLTARFMPYFLTLGLILTACGSSAPGSPGASSSAPASASGPVSSAASTTPQASGKAVASSTGASTTAKPSASASSGLGAEKYAGGDPKGYPIRIAYASPAVASLPFYTALTQGFFAREHLAVTLIRMAPNVAITALAKGEIDFTNSPGNAIEGATRGLPFRMVLSSWQRSPWTIVGKTELKSVQDLKGKVIGTNQAGSTPYLYLQAGLKRAGLAMSDAKIVSSPGTQDTFALLLAGKVDAALVSPPFDVQAEEKGFHEIAFVGDALDLPYIGLGTNTAFINQHRPQLVATIRALMDANRWLKDNHVAEAADLVAKYVGVDPQVAKLSAEKMVPLLSDTGELSVDGARQAIDIQAELTHTKISMTPEQVLDWGPLHEALGKQ